jgi:hypothetical protein
MYWPVHAGGKRIIGAIESTFNISRAQTESAWHVWENYGNMSSVCVLCALDKEREKPFSKDYAVSISFGPGLVIEGTILKTVKNTTRKQFNNDGQVVIPEKLPKELVEKIRIKAGDLSEKNSDFIHSLIENDEFWMSIGTHPIILDAVEQVIGPNILLWGSALFVKPSKVGKATPWHQDGHYWPIKPLSAVTVWIAIDDATEKNGALKVIHGSHKEKVLYEHSFSDEVENVLLGRELDMSRFESMNIHQVIVQSGSISLHDSHIVHSSDRNMSDNNRLALTFRYMPASSIFDKGQALQESETMGVQGKLYERQLHLVRGKDIYNQAVNSTVYDS